MISIVAGILALNMGAHSSDTINDPAFQKMAGMVGGVWVGNLGKMTLKFTYELTEGGKMLEGHGRLTKDGKQVLAMNSKFGWDPVVKKTYYIDFHGHDTVYSGHIELKNDKFVLDFVGLVGDMGHWISYSTMPTKDRYESETYQFKGKKLVPIHLDIKLHREPN